MFNPPYLQPSSVESLPFSCLRLVVGSGAVLLPSPASVAAHERLGLSLCTQAHDFEAYQDLLKQQAGESLGSGERYEAISVFLTETEDYLNKCARR